MQVADLQDEMIAICRGDRGTVPGMLDNGDELSIDGIQWLAARGD